MIYNANEHKNGDDGEATAKFINMLNKIFCNKECCLDYIRFILSKPKDTEQDASYERLINNNIELVKKSADQNYEETKINGKASGVPKPEDVLTGGQFSNLPNEIKSTYLEKYFEIIDGDSFNYKESFLNNLKSMLDKYQNYPEGVFLHILRLRLENFKKKPNNKDNQNTDTHADFASGKNLANAIKKILDSKNELLNEKRLSVLWEYYEYFNGIDENNKLDNKQSEKEKLKQTIEQIMYSADFLQNKKSKTISAAIMTGKLRAYGINKNFTKEHVKSLDGYDDAIKIAVIESFKSATPTCEDSEATNNAQIDDVCYGKDDYKNLSSAVRAKIIDKLSNHSNVNGVFYAMTTFEFIKRLREYYRVDTENVSPEILVALFKLFLKSNPAIGENVTQVLITVSEIQKQTKNFTKQVDLDSKLLSQLSWDLNEKDLESKMELARQFNEQQRQLRNAQIRKSVLRFFGKILFCLVFFIVAIPTLLIRWTLRFFWGILGWFINMFYCNWRRTNYRGQGFKNFGLEFFGFISVGFVGAVARRWFISDPLAICKIFKNLWYRFFGDGNDTNNYKVYISGFIVWLGNKYINGKEVVYRNDSDEVNFGLGDYFKFMSGYSEIINKSEAQGYPDDKVPLQSRLENINTDSDFSPFRYY